MQDIAAKLTPDLAKLIEQTVREFMGAFGLREVVSRPGEDHDGDPVIRVEAHYDLVDRPIDPDIMAELALALPDRLAAAGEMRFPHIRHEFDERHAVKEAKSRPRRSKLDRHSA